MQGQTPTIDHTMCLHINLNPGVLSTRIILASGRCFLNLGGNGAPDCRTQWRWRCMVYIICTYTPKPVTLTLPRPIIGIHHLHLHPEAPTPTPTPTPTPNQYIISTYTPKPICDPRLRPYPTPVVIASITRADATATATPILLLLELHFLPAAPLPDASCLDHCRYHIATQCRIRSCTPYSSRTCGICTNNSLQVIWVK